MIVTVARTAGPLASALILRTRRTDSSCQTRDSPVTGRFPLLKRLEGVLPRADYPVGMGFAHKLDLGVKVGVLVVACPGEVDGRVGVLLSTIDGGVPGAVARVPPLDDSCGYAGWRPRRRNRRRGNAVRGVGGPDGGAAIGLPQPEVILRVGGIADDTTGLSLPQSFNLAYKIVNGGYSTQIVNGKKVRLRTMPIEVPGRTSASEPAPPPRPRYRPMRR